MSFSSQIDLSRQTRRNYNSIFLRRNPFPSTAIPEDIPQITVDRESLIRHFQDVISALYVDGSSSITVLVGGYGSGKSHLLKVFKYNVISQLLDMDNATLAIYIKSPGRNFLDLFLTLIDDIDQEYLKEVSRRLIKIYLNNNENEARKHFIRGTITDSTSLTDMKIEELFDKITIYSFMTAFNNFYIRDVRNSDLLSAILLMSHDTFSNYAWKWFLGENISSDERKILRVSTSINHHRTAYNLFGSLMSLLKLSGITNIILFIDELEKILLLTSTLRSQYQDDFRHVIDENPNNFAIFFSITPSEWRRLADQPTAFTRRLSGNIYSLDDFDIIRIKDLIKGYLYHSRVNDYETKIQDIRNYDYDVEQYPFTNNAIEEIIERTNGRLSSVITLCRKIIDYYLDNVESYIVINDELVKDLSKQEGI